MLFVDLADTTHVLRPRVTIVADTMTQTPSGTRIFVGVTHVYAAVVQHSMDALDAATALASGCAASARGGDGSLAFSSDWDLESAHDARSHAAGSDVRGGRI
jgi:hypothetical protein